MANSRVQRLSGKDRAFRFFAILAACALSLLLSAAAVRAQSADRSRDELPTEELRKLNQSVNALIKKVSPSVVQIFVTGYGPLEEGGHPTCARSRRLKPSLRLRSTV